jgi:hypothetical protein
MYMGKVEEVEPEVMVRRHIPTRWVGVVDQHKPDILLPHRGPLLI